MPHALARVVATRTQRSERLATQDFFAQLTAGHAPKLSAVLHSRAAPADGNVPVKISLHTARGPDGLEIIGVSRAAASHIEQRLRAAFRAAFLPFPDKHVIVRLDCPDACPADNPKQLDTLTAERFDLPIALGLLAIARKLPIDAFQDVEFIGELASDGQIEAIGEIRPTLVAALRAGRQLVIPAANAAEGRQAQEQQRKSALVRVTSHLLEVCAHLRGEQPLRAAGRETQRDPIVSAALRDLPVTWQAARALLISAAGGHSALFVGPPNSALQGLVNCLPALLPPLTPAEVIEAGLLKASRGKPVKVALSAPRPWLAPRDDIAPKALFGADAQPGELAQARHGVCYLKDLPEFSAQILQALSDIIEPEAVQPRTAVSPASYALPLQLVASMAPCACGFHGDRSQVCCCTPQRFVKYWQRIPQALREGMQLRYRVRRLCNGIDPPDNSDRLPSNPELAAQVARARHRQLEQRGTLNARLSAAQLTHAAVLSNGARRALHWLHSNLTSAEAQCVHRLALTIADFEDSSTLRLEHCKEALQLRDLSAASQ